MNIYVPDIEESYNDTIMFHLRNSGTAYLLLHIVQWWCEYVVDDEKRDLPMATYCSRMMNIYYSCLGFIQSNTMSKERIFKSRFMRNNLGDNCL